MRGTVHESTAPIEGSAATWMCLVLVVDTQNSAVLLGRKHRGLGTSRIVGLGGHVDEGESTLVAAVREAREEAGIDPDPAALHHHGEVRFRFPSRRHWNQNVEVFTTSRWSGQPRPSVEITPEWFALKEIPYDAMWDDAKYWLPSVLDGEALDRQFVYSQDCTTVESM